MVTTKYLAKFQSPRAITRSKIIGPERNVNLICNLSLYTHTPNIKSLSQSLVTTVLFRNYGMTDMSNTICSGHLVGGRKKMGKGFTNVLQFDTRVDLSVNTDWMPVMFKINI